MRSFGNKVNYCKSNFGTSTSLLKGQQAGGGVNEPAKTALFDFHKRNGGKLVNFAGYMLPVQYSDLSIIKSHIYTREYGSIFDVSHMLQTYFRGEIKA